MSAETWPTEAAATAAVDAAARAAAREFWATQTEGAEDAPNFDDLTPIQKLALREAVLVPVWAALQALPDPRSAAWEVGHATACEESGSDCLDYHVNPYRE